MSVVVTSFFISAIFFCWFSVEHVHDFFFFLFLFNQHIETSQLIVFFYIKVWCIQKFFLWQISSHFFDYCWRLWQSDVQTILHGFSAVVQSYNPNALEQRHDELYLTSERWLLCLKIIRQLIVSGFQSDAKCIQVNYKNYLCEIEFMIFMHLLLS